MNRKNLLVQYDKELRLRLMYPEARKEITKDVVRFVRNAPGMNFVGFTFANETELDRVIDQQLEYFVPMKQPFLWKVYDHDLLPSLGEKLIAREFVGDREPADVMVLNLKDAAPHLLESGKADIRRVTTPDGLKDVSYVLDEVHGGQNTWVNERLGTHLKVPGYLSVYAAYVDNRPASVAWTHFPHGHFARLFAGCTVPEYRKQGLYTSLLSARLREIRERGYPYAIVEAGIMNRPIVEKHGFKHLTTVYDYKWKGN